MDIQINKQITIKVTVTSGGPISTYQWKSDNIIQINNTDTLTISLSESEIQELYINPYGMFLDECPELICNINVK